jgi:translation initiation factor IF-2
MDILVGHVTHYYNRIGVAVIELRDELKIGDTILLLGHTTDFTQRVASMEINHQRVLEVGAGQEVAIKVDEPVRKLDQVYKVVEDGL